MPAFLGGADQSSEWRTPPIKALLRQWWRIVRAPACKFDHVKLREAEADLFGHAWLKSEAARQSRVRMQLSGGWAGGTLQNLGTDPKVKHPEVDRPPDGMVGGKLYLGYGPITFQQGTRIKFPPAIALGQTVTLRLSFPPEAAAALIAALRLMHWFGTIGGRSRNGWGSLELGGKQEFPNLWSEQARTELTKLSRPVQDCLKLDWPHAFGRDGKGLLIWQTKQMKTADDVVKDLAGMKIGFRTGLQFDGTRRGKVDRRHLLAYPITNHQVREWNAKKKGGQVDSEGRLANQLRFKVARRDGQFVGLIYHLPARLPVQLRAALDAAGRKFVEENELSTWQSVHAELDRKLSRLVASAQQPRS